MGCYKQMLVYVLVLVFIIIATTSFTYLANKFGAISDDTYYSVMTFHSDWIFPVSAALIPVAAVGGVIYCMSNA